MKAKKNPMKRLFRKMCETRWFYTFTASCTATIIGISLTFGINGCRETRRAREEARESIIQAVDELHSRARKVEVGMRTILVQDSLFFIVNDMGDTGVEAADSTKNEFCNALFSWKDTRAHKSVEKIFTESYQLWQVLDQDELTELIGQAYDLINMLEEFKDKHTRQLFEEIKQCELSPRFINESWEGMYDKLLSNSEFCFYMTMRYPFTRTMNIAQEANQKLLERIDSLCEVHGYVKDEIEESDSFEFSKSEHYQNQE